MGQSMLSYIFICLFKIGRVFYCFIKMIVIFVFWCCQDLNSVRNGFNSMESLFDLRDMYRLVRLDVLQNFYIVFSEVNCHFHFLCGKG